MKLIRNTLSSFLFIAGWIPANSHAADVSWGTPTEITAVSDIDLSGFLIHAGTWGTNGNHSVDVNGIETILFEDRPINTTDGSAGVTSNGEFGPGTGDFFTNVTGNTEFEAVMDGMAGGQAKILTLQGLTPGSTYQVQLFVADERVASGPRTMKWSDELTDGAGNESAAFTRNSSPYTIGTFTADDEQQIVYGLPVNDPDTILNAYVLRNIAPAPPGFYTTPATAARLNEGVIGMYTLKPTSQSATVLTLSVTGNADVEVSTDGITFGTSFSAQVAAGGALEVYYRGVSDGIQEPTESHSITHAITTGDGGDYPTGLPINPTDLTLDDSLSGQAGDFAVYSNAGAANEDLATFGATTNTFTTTEVAPSSSAQLLSGGQGIRLSGGKYLVMYNSRINNVSGPTRAEVLAHLSLESGGTVEHLANGWSQGYIRNASGADECVLSGGAIIDAAANAILRLHTERSDANAAKIVRIAPGETDLQLLKLDDQFDTLRLSDSGIRAAANSTTFTNVIYDQVIEASATAMSFTPGTGLVTLNEAGHYLVMANTFFNREPVSANGTRTAFTQRLLLDGSEVVGSKTTTYLRGFVDVDDNCYRGSTSLGMIIEANAGNTLQVQQLQEGIEVVNIEGTRTGLSLVKLPASSAIIKLEDAGGQDLNLVARTPIVFNTRNGTPDVIFSQSTGSSQVIVNQDGPYLFLGSIFSDSGNTDRQVFLQDWTVNSVLKPYGQSSQYARHDLTFKTGNWSGFMSQLSTADIVEMNSSRLAAGGILPGHSVGLQAASILSLSTNAVLVTNEGLGITANTTQTIGANLLQAADASAAPSAITFQVDILPSGGTLRNNGADVLASGTFTQDDINQGRLSFDADGATGQEFGFAFSLSNGGPFQPAGFFTIQIVQSIVMANESGSSDEDTPVTEVDGPVTDLFANDTGDSLSLTAFDTRSVQGANVVVNNNGTFSYDPTAAIALQRLGLGDMVNDSFTYTLTDRIGAHGTGVVDLVISGVEDSIGAVDFVANDSTPSLFEGAGTRQFVVDLVANDGIVRTPNLTTNEILICNYDARGSVGARDGTGLGTWENQGTLGGTDMDWILRTGVTHNRNVSSARAGITAAYEWDGSASATAVLRGGRSPHDLIPGVDLASASLEFWVKLNAADLGQISTLFETGGGTGVGVIIDNGTLRTANGILLSEITYDLLADSLNVLGTSPTSEFFQVVLSMDFDNDLNSLYVNGALVGTAVSTITDWDGGDDSGLGRFQGANHGGYQNTAANTPYDTNYNGSMAIFRIYGAALNATDVFQNFQAIDQGGVDLEGDALTVSGFYDASGTLVPNGGGPLTLASGAIVDQASAQTGRFFYDPDNIPNLSDLRVGETVVDTFTYQASDGNGQTDDAEVSVFIHGLNDPVADTVSAAELEATTFTPNQLAGNDQRSLGASGAFLDYHAADITPAEKAAGIWANQGFAGALHDATINAGSLVTPQTAFGALGQAWEGIAALTRTLDLQGAADGTFEIWFKPSPSSGEQVLYEVGGNGNGMSILYDGDAHEVVWLIDSGTDNNTNQQIRVAAGGLSYDRFNQVIAVIDINTTAGDGNDDLALLYVNNDAIGGFNPNPDAQFLNTGGGVNDWCGADGGGIGVLNNTSALNLTPGPFQGQIAAFRFYQRILTPAEMVLNFEANAQPVVNVSSGLTALGATVTLLPDGSIHYDASAVNIPDGTVVQDSFEYFINNGAGGMIAATATVNVIGRGAITAMDDTVSTDDHSPVVFDVRTNDLGAASATILLQLDVANYQADYQAGANPGDPADFRDGNGFGWQYLWNAPTAWSTGTFDASTGAIGSTNDYTNLLWDPALTAYTVDADGVTSNGVPGNWLTMHATGGHPGLAASEAGGVTNTLERFTIAAYTVASNGYYAITASTITKPGAGGDAVRVLTGVNDSLRSSTRIAPGATGSFDETLGALQGGDTIYVAVGPNASQGVDSFNWDFTISRVAGAHVNLNPSGTVTTDGSSVTYEPPSQIVSLAPGEQIQDSFGYFILAGGAIDSANVTVTIHGDNEAPQGVADTFSTDEDTPLTDALLGNDTDVDTGHAALLAVLEVEGQAGNVGIATGTTGGGSVTVQASGSFTYDPNGAFEGLSEGESAADSFTYLAVDPLGLAAASNTLVSITVTGVDDGVIANSNAYATTSSDPVAGNLITDDTGDGMDVSIDTNDTLNVLSLDLSGTLGKVTAVTSHVVGVQGSVVLSNDVVVSVNFGADQFTDPVVIASPPTYNEAEATIILIRNVDALAGTFDISLKEQPELGAAASDTDGEIHAAETINWMVLEAGNYRLANGRRMEVGKVSTTATAATFETVNFSVPFETAPIVLHTIQTSDGDANEMIEFFGTRMGGVATTTSFQVGINDLEGSTNVRSTPETIGWMAIEAGDGRWNGDDYEVGLTGASVTDTTFTIDYLRTYGAIPTLFPAQQTINGADPTQLRMQNAGISSAQVLAREDRFADGETAHAAERVGYLAVPENHSYDVYLYGEVPGAFTYDPDGAFDGLAPGATATDSFVYVLVDSSGNTSTNTVTITITGGTSIIAQWRVDNGFSSDGSGLDEGNLEDKDMDGLLNLHEFAFGTDPNVSDNERLSVNGNVFVPGRAYVFRLQAGPPEFRFVRRADYVAAGLEYVVEFTAGNLGLGTLEAWVANVETPRTIVPDGGSGYEMVGVPFMLFPSNGETRTYGRVRVVYTGP